MVPLMMLLVAWDTDASVNGIKLPKHHSDIFDTGL